MRRTQCRRRDDASKSGGERRPERVRPVRLRQAVCAAVVAVVRGTQLVCVRGVRFRAQNRGQGCSQARATNRERTARRTRAGQGSADDPRPNPLSAPPPSLLLFRDRVGRERHYLFAVTLVPATTLPQQSRQAALSTHASDGAVCTICPDIYCVIHGNKRANGHPRASCAALVRITRPYATHT